MIRREITHLQAGRAAGIVAKFNSMTDTAMIEEMYAASREGVTVDLIVRGICCLRPGWPGRSETIRVGSIVGRFLEHSRVYRFINGGNEEIYLGSADLMNRNLDRRVEVLFPIEDERIKERIVREVLDPALLGKVEMRWVEMNGVYEPPRRGEEKAFNFQDLLLEPALIG